MTTTCIFGPVWRIFRQARFFMVTSSILVSQIIFVEDAINFAILMEARHFYHKKHKQTRAERNESPLIRLRKFNNAIKSILISDALRNVKNANVLDLCCGTGGDLGKFRHTSIAQWTGIDISQGSVEEAARRYKDGQYKFTASLYCGDGFQQCIVPDGSRDLVSCQFALHYAFANPELANRAFETIGRALKSGGQFIATFPNATVIRSHLPHWKTKYFEIDGTENGYTFSMGESVQNVTEWLTDDFDTLAKKHGLSLVRCEHFGTVFHRARENGQHADLLRSVKFSNDEVVEFSLDQLYIAVVMEKI